MTKSAASQVRRQTTTFPETSITRFGSNGAFSILRRIDYETLHSLPDRHPDKVDMARRATSEIDAVEPANKRGPLKAVVEGGRTALRKSARPP